MSTPIFSICIVTRNRINDLRRALDSCLRQTDVDLEILVYDDASTDATSEVVLKEFPSIRYFRSESQVGYIVLRNRGFREAIGKYIVSLDDDAFFSSNDCLRQIQQKWDAHPNAGALAISYLEPSRAEYAGFMQQSVDGSQLRNFIGCAHSIRRNVAIALGGYREYFVHQGEERDLCLRMLATGLEVRYVEVAPIVHLPSPQRNHGQLAYLGVRNTFLFSVLNAPFPTVLTRILSDAINLFRYKLNLRTLWRRGAIVGASLIDCMGFISRRRPVSRVVFQRFRSLPIHGPRPPRAGDGNLGCIN
jgi:glycosyltransferase involved in cell wall biosynthesis